MASPWLFAAFNGLALGMAGFLVAAGLTLVFGILKILNFAHGAFFMVGAYVTFSIVGPNPSSLLWLLGASLVGAAVVGCLGLLTDAVVLRRLRERDPHDSLIATFAVLLVCNGAVKLIWGLNFHAVSPPPGLDGVVDLGGVVLPSYSLAIVGAGLLVFVGLEIAIHRMWIGKVVQAVARDPWMSGVMGVNTSLVMTGSVVASFALAGLAGGLLLANQSLSNELGGAYLLLAFNAVVIGGLGNVRGAFLASLLLGLVESLSTLVTPSTPGLAPYGALILFLLVRPEGLFPAHER